MMTWDELFQLFTQKIRLEIRSAVLQAIADPEIKIIAGAWRSNGNRCLFALAEDVARALKPNLKEQRLFRILGISDPQFGEGILRWDTGSDRTRRLFRARIRQFVQAEKEQKKKEEQAALIAEIKAIKLPEQEETALTSKLVLVA